MKAVYTPDPAREPKRPPKKFCIHGHTLAETGYYLQPRGDGGYGRRCRLCAIGDVQVWQHKRIQKQKEKEQMSQSPEGATV